MGRRRKKVSKLGVFKKYLGEHPEWVDTRDNTAILSQFAQDHPNIPVDQSVKQALFNAKNFVRRGGKGTPGRKKKIAAVRREMGGSQVKGGALQLLESNVDDCLAMARQIGREQIGDVISHLHRARNILVMKIES